MATIELHSRDWAIQRTDGPRRGGAGPRRGSGRRAAAEASSFPPEFLTDASEVAAEFVAAPRPPSRAGAGGRRAGTAAPSPLDFSTELAAGEAALVAIRHPSGALTFHLPVTSTAAPRRGAGAAGGGRGTGRARFVIDIRSADVDTGRRSLVTKAVKAILIKVGGAIVDRAAGFVLAKLAAFFERQVWKARGLPEGWVRVARDAGGQFAVTPGKPVTPGTTDRTLLFLHGTFSSAAGAFSPLASTTFFQRIAPIYGDRVFAFNHFSVSQTPEENAHALLQGLADKPFTFDVITHSRGGLVLRNLVERASTFGALARRFTLGRAVLVASPNEGTPLATPRRWQDTVGWIANLIELFPDNPFTTGAEFVANGLVWMARHASGDLPGLHAMDGAGDLIGDLQAPPGPPPNAYSALVSNYNPSREVLARMLDVGVDQFFASANDLVVPSEGGWRIDPPAGTFIPGPRIGCFGPGGNLATDAVTHLNFFAQPETADFLVTALSGQAQPLTAIDPARLLPDRRLLRAAGAPGAAGGATPFAAGAPTIAPTAPPGTDATHVVSVDGTPVAASDTFQLVVIPSTADKKQAQILAHYGAARVVEDFPLRGEAQHAGERWYQIVAYHERIKHYIDDNVGEMLTPQELTSFGEVLFETLLPGKVRRLYDTARSLQRSERLNVILTSAIPWVADNPWEFAYDPVRKTSLATEDLHFIRNVMTAVPAEIIDDREPLRILVASAQPIELGRLSIDEEVAVIARGFEPLRDAGLAEIEILPRATPASLHGYVSTGRFSVVHVIGHGEYDEKQDRGFLIFQDDNGKPYPIDDRSAREILCGRSIRLVFLNACETATGGRADFNSGLAPALMAGGIPIVVANQYKVLDKSATFFAQHFYWSLAHGLAVGEAAREARVAVNYSLSGEAIDWAVPVVYARDPNSRLAPRREIDRRRMPSPAVRGSSRRKVADHDYRVAVWDTNAQFPELRQLLDRMSDAQRVFGFEVVDLSVPIDAWHMKEGQRYLDADKFAERLAPQIPQLGVHYIATIVNEWMVHDVQSDPVYNIYGWWPAKDKPPVLMFSMKGFKLAPTGAATERALINMTVSGIAGYVLDRKSHRRGPKDCPNDFNPRRSLSVLTMRQRFCKPCTDLLRKLDRKKLDAMNALLALVDTPARAPRSTRPRSRRPRRARAE